MSFLKDYLHEQGDRDEAGLKTLFTSQAVEGFRIFLLLPGSFFLRM